MLKCNVLDKFYKFINFKIKQKFKIIIKCIFLLEKITTQEKIIE